jgi:hypothetical protein
LAEHRPLTVEINGQHIHQVWRDMSSNPTASVPLRVTDTKDLGLKIDIEQESAKVRQRIK